jgi:hypothetical protein
MSSCTSSRGTAHRSIQCRGTPARGGLELCPGRRKYDPETMEGGKAGETIWCICECHRKRTRPPSHHS